MVRGTHLVFFQKERFQVFISEIVRVVGLLGEKFIFEVSWDNQNFQESQLFEYIYDVLLTNFPE